MTGTVLGWLVVAFMLYGCVWLLRYTLKDEPKVTRKPKPVVKPPEDDDNWGEYARRLR